MNDYAYYEEKEILGIVKMYGPLSFEEVCCRQNKYLYPKTIEGILNQLVEKGSIVEEDGEYTEDQND